MALFTIASIAIGAVGTFIGSLGVTGKVVLNHKCSDKDQRNDRG